MSKIEVQIPDSRGIYPYENPVRRPLVMVSPVKIPDSRGIYPYENGKFGYLIPELIEETWQHDHANGESGEAVKAIAGSDLLMIETYPGGQFHLFAHVQTGTLTLNLRTRGKAFGRDNWQHPDMFARHFVDYAMIFFKANDMPINRFQGMWKPYSINYQKFKERQTDLSDIEAAESTWTGQTVKRHGFVPMHVSEPKRYHDEEGPWVIVDFVRS